MKPGMWVAMVALSSFAVVQVNVSRLRGSVPPFVSVWFTPDDHLERAALRHRAGMVKLMDAVANADVAIITAAHAATNRIISFCISITQRVLISGRGDREAARPGQDLRACQIFGLFVNSTSDT